MSAKEEGSKKDVSVRGALGLTDRLLNKIRTRLGVTMTGSFKLDKHNQRPLVLPVKPARWLIKETFALLKQEWRLFLGLGLLYVLIYAYIAAGTPGLSIATLRHTLQESKITGIAQIAATAGTAIDGSIQTNNSNGPFYATFLTITFSLATIWAVRHIIAGHTVRIRDALYNGTVSFISTSMLLVVLFLQMLPITFGVYLYIEAKANHILTGGVTDMVMFLVTALLTILSLYWLASTLLALVAVTLPGVYPGSALKAARDLAAYRRWHIVMRILSYVVIMALVWVVVLAITVSNPLTVIGAGFMINLLRGFTMITAVVYIYKLYRSLVDEADEQASSSSANRKAA
ncbi:MAG TPA: hypothetical protein VGS28_00520 [Candidatus Saccharimonadales bacterium]|nr:hypothetical protein [Candidatus Saccharimonadales bacterium]